jgi:CheY-like chemotaxis protein
MLTANARPEHVAASTAAGADRHLGKPITAAALFDAIQDVLARPGASDPDATDLRAGAAHGAR